MSPVAFGALGFVVLFALLAAGMPIGFAMALVGFVGYVFIGGMKGGLALLAMVPYGSVATYVLTVLPLFILMGELASVSGLIKGAFSAAHKWFGQLPGGLAVATIGACAAFAAVCGSSMATASAMTSVALPEMRRYKYEHKLALGSIAAGGTLGVLIPPSTVFIVYAIFAEQSVGRLFMAGFIPGILLASLFTIAIFLWVKRTPSLGPPAPKFSWRERLVSSKDIMPVLILALVVLGGIWGGIFTPNEAAGIGAFGAFVFGLGMRQLTMKNFISALMSTITITAMVFTIIIGAMIYNNFIVVCEVPAVLARYVETLAWPPLGILIAILAVYLILGCIMDAFAMCVLTLPIFIPILANLQLDLIWFGVLFVVMIEMASITPPIGMNVFVVSGMARDVPMYTIFRGIVPFLIAQIICQALLITFPQIALFLPNTMMK